MRTTHSLSMPAAAGTNTIAATVPASGTSLLRLPAVMARVGMKRTTVYGLIKQRKFPAPVKIGKASRWTDDEISAWIEQRRAERVA